MSDGALPSRQAAPRLARAEGRLALSFRVRSGITVVGRFEQAGCLRARLPRPERGAFSGAVTLNTAGGIASGDRLDLSIAWHEEACATVSAAAAERVYRARSGEAPARVATTLTVAPGATAEWLPQETILFDGARLERSLVVELGEGAGLVAVEALVFGRTARGETMREGLLVDRVSVHRGGALVHADVTRLDGKVAEILARRAVADGAAAVASLIAAGPSVASALAPLREALGGAPRAEGGASLRDGLLLARIVARDGAALRRAVLAALAALRHDRPVPRVWRC